MINKIIILLLFNFIIVKAFPIGMLYENVYLNDYINNYEDYIGNYEDYVEYKILFNKYQTTFNRQYNNNDYIIHFKNFMKNNKLIDTQNSLNHKSWTAGWSDMSDKTIDNFNIVDKNYEMDKYHQYNVSSIKSLPKYIDWTNQLVSEVKNQNNYGSSWLFSGIGSLEGLYSKLYGKLINLSLQNLIDCIITKYDCDNQNITNNTINYNTIITNNHIMKYVIENGINTEQNYSYTGYKGKCKYSPYTHINNIKVTDIIHIKPGDTDGLLHAIATVGPIATSICIDEDFLNYKFGIYNSTKCDKNKLTHGVLIVGYGQIDNIPYYIIKNSWGTDWGINGYALLCAHDPNIMGISNNALFPIGKLI